MNVTTATEQWLRKASDDRVAALDLSQGRGARLADIVCFHCQQSAEKHVKAVLTQAKIDFPYTHDLRELIDRASDAQDNLNELASVVKVLAPFAVDVRYPGMGTDDRTMRVALEAMETIRTVCLRVLGVDESYSA